MINLKWGLTAAAAAVIISVGLGLISGVGILHILLRALVFAVVFFGFGFGLRFLINSFFPELLYMDESSPEQESFGQPGSKINITIDSTGEYAVPELYKAPGDSKELGNIDDLISGVFRPRSAADDQQYQTGLDRNKEESYNIGNADQGFPEEDNFTFQDDGMFDEPQVVNAVAEKPKAEKPRAEKPGVDKPGFEKPGFEKPTFTPSFGDDTGVGGLPDLEMFAMSFSSGVGGEPRISSQPVTPPAVVMGGEEQEEFEPAQPAQQSRYVAGKPTPMKGNFDPMQLAKGISTVLTKDKK